MKQAKLNCYLILFSNIGEDLRKVWLNINKLPNKDICAATLSELTLTDQIIKGKDLTWRHE